ncbi:hypothetical protein ABPG75_007545 [Micractinium tetrahymenae]
MAKPPARPQPKPLYSSAEGEAALRRLYDDTLAALPFQHEERWVDTPSFGRAHVLVAGPEGAPPLMLWHGTAAPGPLMLRAFDPLVKRFRVYCPDIPLQAGSRSEPAVLDPASHGHGRWCVEVMEGLGLLGGAGLPPPHPPLHVGISLGGSVLLDLAVVKPEAVGGAALLVPGSLHPEFAKHLMPLSVALSFALYRWLPCRLTAWLVLDRMCDAPYDQEDPTLKNILLGIRHCNYFPEGPLAFADEQLRRLAGPTLLVAAERDSFGPGAATADRARSVWPASQLKVELLPGKHVGNKEVMAQTSQRVIRFFEERGVAGPA